MIEFKFRFRNYTEGSLSHQWKTCFLRSCPFEDKLLEACFLEMMWRRMSWLRHLLVEVGGGGGQVSTWSHERHPYPDSYVLAFLPQLLVAG